MREDNDAPVNADNAPSDEGDDVWSQHSKAVMWLERMAVDMVKTLKDISREFYHSLPGKPDLSEVKWFLKQESTKRNRYGNIFCLDRTRVALRHPRNNSDYIHANWVDMPGAKCRFILTQAPLPETLGDFWSMVWEEGVTLIICLTKILEKGQMKTAEYWPTTCGRNHYQRHGYIHLRCLGVKNQQHYALSRLEAVHEKTKKSRQLLHYLYLDWPDHRVPICTHNFLDLIHFMDNEIVNHKGDNIMTILTHCSAGVGRSGTLVALHHLVRTVNCGEMPDVENAVKCVRNQRAHAVQGPEQYMFIYWALTIYILQNSKLPQERRKELIKRFTVMRQCSTKSTCIPIQYVHDAKAERRAKPTKRKTKKAIEPKAKRNSLVDTSTADGGSQRRLNDAKAQAASPHKAAAGQHEQEADAAKSPKRDGSGRNDGDARMAAPAKKEAPKKRVSKKSASKKKKAMLQRQ